MQANQGKKKKKELEKGKKAVKNLMNTIFHHKDSKVFANYFSKLIN